MDKPQPNLDFRFMSLTYKFRDLFLPRMSILKEVGIKSGFYILDYGCGPGNYVKPLAELIGESGKIYALDINPLAIRMVRSIALKKQLTNVNTICSDCQTGLPDNSMDVVLLYDTLHTLGDPDRVLEEIHRVLKSNGILSLSDHHMKENEIVSKLTNKGLFKILRKGKKTFSFSKRGVNRLVNTPG